MAKVRDRPGVAGRGVWIGRPIARQIGTFRGNGVPHLKGRRLMLEIERIFIEFMASDREVEASREGAKERIYGTYKTLMAHDVKPGLLVLNGRLVLETGLKRGVI